MKPERDFQTIKIIDELMEYYDNWHRSENIQVRMQLREQFIKIIYRNLYGSADEGIFGKDGDGLQNNSQQLHPSKQKNKRNRPVRN